LFFKGLALGSQRNYTEAIKYFDKIIGINPKDIDALIKNGLALDKLGNHTGAIAYMDQALAIDPNNKEAKNLKNEISKPNSSSEDEIKPLF
jgi:tetratricopeptide (TPR) repeat protein